MIRQHDIGDSCARVRLWNSSLNVLRVVNTSPRLPSRSASQLRAQTAMPRSPSRRPLRYRTHHDRQNSGKKKRRETTVILFGTGVAGQAETKEVKKSTDDPAEARNWL